MLERETERLLNLVQQNTIGKNEAISVKEILAAEIPYPLKVFFRADVERILHDELRQARAHSRFNYPHREVESLQRQMNSILVLNFSFLREEFLQKLDDGLHLVLNFLLRPQWTLSSYIFNTNASVTIADLKGMFTYFGAYEYMKEVLLRYLEEKRLDSLTFNEFQDLLWRIDAEYVRRKNGSELARLTTPIYDFIHFSPVPSSPPPYTIPVQAKTIMKFFEDKRLRVLCEILEHHLTQRGILEVTMQQLEDILEEAHRSNAEAFRAEETFIKKETTQSSAAESVSTPHPSPSSPQQRDQSTYDITAKRANLPELQQLISEDDRKRFLKKIFRKDETHYATSLSELNSMTSWKEASIYIDKILIANDVDPYSNEAVRFSELMHRRFFPRTPRR